MEETPTLQVTNASLVYVKCFSLCGDTIAVAAADQQEASIETQISSSYIVIRNDRETIWGSCAEAELDFPQFSADVMF